MKNEIQNQKEGKEKIEIGANTDTNRNTNANGVNNMKKITKATFKKILRENSDNLFINVFGEFDPMSDSRESRHEGWTKLERETEARSINENNLGYKGIWLVGRGRDFFKPFFDGNYYGIYITNCCGSFTVCRKTAKENSSATTPAVEPNQDTNSDPKV